MGNNVGRDLTGALIPNMGMAYAEEDSLRDLQNRSGCNFPGCDYHPADRKNWMLGLNPENLNLNKIVWPGTHDSGTDVIAWPVSDYAQCQTRSIYEQLVLGTRLLDIRVNQHRTVCHDTITTYSFDVVVHDIKRFISETSSEIIILEVRTEFGQTDPDGFEQYLEQQLGEYLIHQDDQVFRKTVAQILPKRIICIWKPRNSDPPRPGRPVWSSGYLTDNWINTDLPATKFEGNLNNLSQQPPVSSRRYFYRVEHTLTAQVGLQEMRVHFVTERIRGYARLFIAQCFSRNIADRLQGFSTDFIDEDFVDACVGLTLARIEGRA